MLEENKTVELKDEDLEKVSGGAASSKECANCGYFMAKNPDGGRNFDNCYYAKPSIGSCKKYMVEYDDAFY